MVDAIKILVDQLDLPDDVIGIIHEHLQGYYQYRRCARELLMPHFIFTTTYSSTNCYKMSGVDHQLILHAPHLIPCSHA